MSPFFGSLEAKFPYVPSGAFNTPRKKMFFESAVLSLPPRLKNRIASYHYCVPPFFDVLKDLHSFS